MDTIGTTIETISFTSPAPGPRVLVFGAIHGNELCGPRAIARITEDLRSGKLVLKKGSVCFVPVSNPLAHQKNVRFMKENLNRIFKPSKNPKSYEAKLANVLCKLVDQCDVLLDIHSTTAEGIPFIYLDYPDKRTRAWAQVLGPKAAVVGWPELYKKFGSEHTSFDTTTYAAQKGKDGLLVECGQHTAASAEAIAYNAIRNTLKHYGLIAGKPKNNKPLLVKIDQGFFREKDQELAHKAWQHLDTVTKGSPLILTKKGPIVAPYDGCVVMPKYNAAVGQDWLYFGRTLK